MILLSILLFLIVIVCTTYFLKRKYKQKDKFRTLIVIGSGGHTAEMLRLVSNLSDQYYPRLYVMADNDTTSRPKIIESDSRFGNDDVDVVKIPRSRREHSIELRRMALKGIRVVEMAGLAPGPMCGMILADFGASVIRVDRIHANTDLDCLSNGKRALSVNMKNKEGADIVRKLLVHSDVLIEPFRPGVMESLGLGPNEVMKRNPSLVYARLTGFGQNGSFSKMAGHDINYVGMSGVLSMLGRENEKPTPPINLLADFGGGGLLCALGIAFALLERGQTGKGQVVDSAMVDGTAYLSSWIFRSQNLPIWGNKRGCNILDGGSHFYDTYETKDGKFMAVGALESQFYKILLEKLEIKDVEHFGNFKAGKKLLESKFKTKTQSEWCAVFDGTDGCVTPVLEPQQASLHPHNVARNVFKCTHDGTFIPMPAPKLSRTPARSTAFLPAAVNGAHTRQILQQLGYDDTSIAKLASEGTVLLGESQTLRSNL